MSKSDESKDFIGHDGLIYCGICNRRRQLRVENPLFGPRVVTTMCKCDEDEEAAKKAFQAAAEAKDKVKRLRYEGISSANYETMTFDCDDGKDGKAEWMRKYADNWERALCDNIGLLFHGPVDGGKTFWAACIVNDLISRGVSAMITTIPTLVSAMQQVDGGKSQVLEKLSSVSFLVLDDIGYERRTQYADEKLFEIVDARYRAKKPLIVTTNLSLKDLQNPSDMAYKRAFSRIVEMCTPIFFPAMGRRDEVARSKAPEALALLGLEA